MCACVCVCVCVIIVNTIINDNNVCIDIRVRMIVCAEHGGASAAAVGGSFH